MLSMVLIQKLGSSDCKSLVVEHAGPFTITLLDYISLHFPVLQKSDQVGFRYLSINIQCICGCLQAVLLSLQLLLTRKVHQLYVLCHDASLIILMSQICMEACLKGTDHPHPGNQPMTKLY